MPEGSRIEEEVDCVELNDDVDGRLEDDMKDKPTLTYNVNILGFIYGNFKNTEQNFKKVSRLAPCDGTHVQAVGNDIQC